MKPEFSTVLSTFYINLLKKIERYRHTLVVLYINVYGETRIYIYIYISANNNECYRPFSVSKISLPLSTVQLRFLTLYIRPLEHRIEVVHLHAHTSRFRLQEI